MIINRLSEQSFAELSIVLTFGTHLSSKMNNTITSTAILSPTPENHLYKNRSMPGYYYHDKAGVSRCFRQINSLATTPSELTIKMHAGKFPSMDDSQLCRVWLLQKKARQVETNFNSSTSSSLSAVRRGSLYHELRENGVQESECEKRQRIYSCLKKAIGHTVM